MALHGIQAGDFFHELLQQVRYDWQNVMIAFRTQETYHHGWFPRLRYWHRQLLKPPNIPRTPHADWTLALYRLYGHPCSHVTSALEGHVVCSIVRVSVRLSQACRCSIHAACLLCAFLFTLISILALEVLSVIITLTTFLLFWIAYEALTKSFDLLMDLFDFLDIARAEFHRWYPPYTLSNVVATCYLALAGFGLLGCVWVVGKVCVFVYERIRPRTGLADFQECRACVTEPRTQYYEPCRHICCCVGCARRLYQCPVCKTTVKTEITLPTLMASLCVLCRVADVCRVLVPCGHVVCCAGCAAVLDDCPVCWEHVTDDKPCFLP